MAKNVTFQVDAKKKELTIKVDISQNFGPSESGKTLIIASTSGNADIGHDGIKFGLNVFKKNPDYKKE